jgi:hypothetical protein
MNKNLARYSSLGCIALSLALLAGCSSSSVTIVDVRNNFVEAGGTCTGSTPATTTTVSDSSDEEKWPFASVQSLDCGEDEPNISMYDSVEDAKRSTYFLDALKAGLILSLGSQPSQTMTLMSDKATINLSSDKYSQSEATEIAKKMDANLQLGLDDASRQKTFNDLVKTTDNGGLGLTAEACLSKKLLSSDGKSVSFDTKGEEDSEGDLLGSAYCVLRALIAPDYIFKNVGETRALDGLLEENWADYRVSWRYHPNSGMQMTIIYQG